MPHSSKPSLILGFILNLLWPGIGQIYFRRIGRGILFAVLGLFLPGIMFIVSSVDLYFLSKKLPSIKDGSWPQFDIEWQKPLKIILIAGFVLVCVYSIYFISIFFFMKHLRNSKTSMTMQEMGTIQKTLEKTFKTAGAYSDSLTELIKGRPLRKMWLSDAWKTPYRYSKDNGSYRLISAGKDRQFDTEDDLSVSGR